MERTSRVGFKGLASRKIRASGSTISIRTSRLISELMIRKNWIKGEFISEKSSSTLSFYLLGLALITALFLATLTVHAQSNATDDALDGYVLDESGAVIPGAKIVARNVQTSIEFTANADGQGYFRFPLLSVGSYEIVASAGGFREFKQMGVSLEVGRQVRLSITLKVGAASETVTVSADASVIETGQPAVSEAARLTPIKSRRHR